MKILYIEAKSKAKQEEFFIDENFIKKLPKEIFLSYTIQNKQQAEVMKKALENKGIKLAGFQQVLGCSKTRVKEGIPIILIGHGRFHALNLALQNKRQIILYSNGSSAVIGEKEIKEHQERLKNSINKFLHSYTLAIIISLKPGQENMKQAKELERIINKKYPEKKVFFFISNNINLSEIENFNIDFWINSACPGLLNDSPKIANIDDVFEFFSPKNLYSGK